MEFHIGMGELHLDIIHKRLQSDFKADADLGKIQNLAAFTDIDSLD